MVVGLTGGIGCGKSTAASFFERRGFRRLDSDRLVRERVLTDPKVVAAIRSRFGDGVLEPVSHSVPAQIDRAALGARVFASDGDRRWLEELTHPLVFALWREAFASVGEESRWIVEVPLLFEKGLENWFDFTVCVACAPERQLVRLEQRGLPRVLAGQRISTQLPLARKIELADHVLWNDGTPEFLEHQVGHLIEVLHRGV